MRYILDSRIALRSWQQVPYAYYRKGSPYAKGLKKEEFELLRSCDGKGSRRRMIYWKLWQPEALFIPAEGKRI